MLVHPIHTRRALYEEAHHHHRCGGCRGLSGRGERDRGSTGSTGSTALKCHPSYKLKCLKPNAYDYDCIGGRGNGPLYTGLVKVVGRDVFRLDADHDGWGCE